jgi:hypothetical protein
LTQKLKIECPIRKNEEQFGRECPGQCSVMFPTLTPLAKYYPKANAQ